MRRVIGLAAALFAMWLIYRSTSALATYVSFGGPLGEAIADPVCLGPIFAALLGLIGGGLAALGRPGALIFLSVGGAAFGALGALILVMGGDISLWRMELISAAVLLTAGIALAVIKRV
ncbi:MAG: hypothetical protein AAF719_12515 [Pseudomonadota bacterium]